MQEEFEPLSEQLTWQDALDSHLTRRLIRPLVQPGVMDGRMARVIIARSQRLNNRLPLLTQLQGRGVARNLSPEQIPIVYAQPLSREASTNSASSIPIDMPQPQANKPPVVQAKFARSNKSSSNITPSLERSPSVVQSSKLTTPQIQRKLDGHQTQINAAKQLPTKQAENHSISPSSIPPAEQTPIIYAQLSTPNTSQTDTLAQTDTQNFEANKLPVVQSSKPVTSQVQRKLDGHQTPILEVHETELNSKASKLPIVQAKIPRSNYSADIASLSVISSPVVPNSSISTGQLQKKQNGNETALHSYDALTPPPNSEERLLSSKLLPQQIPIVYAQALEEKLKQNAIQENKLPVVQATSHLNSLLPHQPDPLVFSLSPAQRQTSAVNRTGLASDEDRGALRQGNPTPAQLPIERLMNRINETTVIQNNAAMNSQSIAGIQINRTINPKAEPQPNVDLDALVDKVERKLMRRLVVESERRGQKRWR